MNGLLLYCASAAALGGFMFGFDAGVISGCEKAIQSEFGLKPLWHGLVVSIALFGTVAGSFGACVPCDRLGRKPTLWMMAVMFVASGVGCMFTPHDAAWGPVLLGVSRFVGGLAIGGASVAVPLYIVEISPDASRGRLTLMNQLNIVVGILMSYVSNYLIAKLLPNADPATVWRLMLGASCLPALVFLALLGTIPESPRWLMLKGRVADARRALERTGCPDAEGTILSIETSLRARQGGGGRLFARKYRKPICLTLVIALFSQLSGVNAVIYYAPRIFQMIFGEGTELSALAGTIGVGCVNLLLTLAAIPLIDRIGRRTLMIVGPSVMVAMHAMVAWQLSLPNPNAMVAAAGVFGVIAGFAVSFGAVIWVFISEIFPNAVRAKGQAFGSLVHWVGCIVVSWTFPAVAEATGLLAFAFFAVMMVLLVCWAVLVMPETKGGSIDDLS